MSKSSNTLFGKNAEAQVTTNEQSPGTSETDSESYRQDFLARFTKEDDRRIMRKVDLRFLPLLGLMYLVKQIDLSNAANVKVLQVGESRNVLVQLHMTADDYNWVQTFYYISYVIFELPSNLLVKKFTPSVWQSRIFASWGVILACHAAIKNKEGFYTLRFLLGMMEAGYFPCMISQLNYWYRSDEQGKPIMWTFGFSALSNIVSSLLCYAMSYMNGIGGLSAWQWVFLLEGVFTVFFAASIYFILPDYPKSPASSKWLTPDEQEYLELRLASNAPKTEDKAFDWKEVIESLQPSLLAFTLSQFFFNVAGYGLSWELPTITTSLGFTKLPKNQLLNIPPAGLTVMGVIAASWFLSRAYMSRPLFIQLLTIGTLVFFIILCIPVSRGATYAACIVGTAFYSVWFIPFWAWRSATVKGTTGTAFTLALQTSLAQIGGAIAPQIFRSKYAYNGYRVPFIICTVCVALALLFNLWVWYLTNDVEKEVNRVRRLRIKSELEGKVYTGEDIQF